MFEKLKRCGLKNTPIRRAILIQLEKNNSKLTGSDLINQLKTK